MKQLVGARIIAFPAHDFVSGWPCTVRAKSICQRCLVIAFIVLFTKILNVLKKRRTEKGLERASAASGNNESTAPSMTSSAEWESKDCSRNSDHEPNPTCLNWSVVRAQWYGAVHHALEP